MPSNQIKVQKPTENLSDLTAPAPLDVRGSNQAFVRFISQGARDGVLTSALELMSKEALTSLTLAPKKSSEPSLSVRGSQLVLEFHDKKTRPEEVLRFFRAEVLGRAVVESLVTSAEHFACARSTACEASHDVARFARALAEYLPDSKRNDPVRAAIEQHRELLNRRQASLVKKLERVCQVDARTADDAEQFLERFIDIVRQSQAISLVLNEQKERRATIGALEEAVVSCLKTGFASWRAAVFRGDTVSADAITAVFEAIPSRIESPGFNREFPLPNAGEALALRQEPLLALFQPPTPPFGLMFAPQITPKFHQLAREMAATAAIDAEIRADQVQDEDPAAYLQEKLLERLPHAALALKRFERELPNHVPPEIDELIRTVCRLRFHGDESSQSLFAFVACNLTSQEQRHLRLKAPELIARHSEDYMTLVEFLATWPLQKRDSTAPADCQAIINYLNRLVDVSIFSLTKNLEHSFYEFVKDGAVESTIKSPAIVDVRLDLRGLERAAHAVAHPPLLAYVGPATASMKRGLTALMVRNMPEEDRSLHLGRLRFHLEEQQALRESLPRSIREDDAIMGLLPRLSREVEAMLEGLIHGITEYERGLDEDLA